MVSSYLGYLILFGFAIIFIGISIVVAKKFPIEGVDDFVVAGRSIPYALIAASVMVSWVWTTTIMGAAEAGMWFGISGGFNYSWGACIPFFVFIPLLYQNFTLVVKQKNRKGPMKRSIICMD